MAERKKGTAVEDIGLQNIYDESDIEELQERWREIRQPVVPEPRPFEEVDYSPPRRIAQVFKDSGLQIIVKMVSVELTPEKPSRPAGSWHVGARRSLFDIVLSA